MEEVQLNNSIEIEIKAEASKYFGGFRGTDVYIFPKNDLIYFKSWNFLSNDLHSAYAILCIFIGFMGMALFRSLKSHRNGFMYLISASLLMTPYYLMSTGFWELVTNNPQLPFAIHISSQAVAVPLFILYSIFSGLESKTPAFLTKNGIWFSMAAFLGAVFLIIGLVNFPLFMNLVTAWFIVLILLFILSILRICHHGGNPTAVIIAGLLFIANLVTDILFGSFYPLGHGAFIFSLIGLSKIINAYVKGSEENRSLLSLVAGFIPKSIVKQITGMTQEAMPITEIRKALSGSRNLSIIFIDICGYQNLSLKLDADIDRVTEKFFAFCGRVLDSYDIESLKTMGDNIIFVGGLSEKMGQNPAIIAERTMTGLMALLQRIPELNHELAQAGLPEIKIKISATMGGCRYRLKGTEDEFRFDLEGHPLTSAKRLEEAMNDDFYKKYGQNTALISYNLFQSCSNMKILVKFHSSEHFVDKSGLPLHGIVFSSAIDFNAESFKILLSKHTIHGLDVTTDLEMKDFNQNTVDVLPGARSRPLNSTEKASLKVIS